MTPKLPSATSLLNTYGYAPSAVAVTQLAAVQPGGSWVTPGWMSASRYVLPLTSRFPAAADRRRPVMGECRRRRGRRQRAGNRRRCPEMPLH